MSTAVETAAVDIVAGRPARELGAERRIATGRLVGVELRKMFDTRSGFWLVTGGAILAAVATVAIVLFAPDDELTYEQFAAAIGMPLTVLLPMVAILAVTSEWSQRTGLATFTLVPDRRRVIGAKLAATLLVGVASIVLAFAIGALGNVVGSRIAGVPLTWDVSAGHAATIFLADGLTMLVGFTLAILIRNSPGAIVAYFVYGLVLPGALGALAGAQEWFRDLQGWVDFQYASTRLYEANVAATDWAHLATSGLIWLVVPLAIGLRLVVRSEVK